MMRTLALAALSLVQVWAGGHMGHEHLAVVRVFSTDEEVMLLKESGEKWDDEEPCEMKSNMSAIDLILVYSKDLMMNPMANKVVMDLMDGFKIKMDMEMYNMTNVTNPNATMYDWMKCFSDIKYMSAGLNPEQDVYDSNGYTTNKHWVSGPNHVFKSIMDAMFTGAYMDMYDSFFLMEMDAVPIKDYWLDQFEKEAHEVADGNIAIRGSQYLGDKWDLFKHMMPKYLVDHINGNAIYNLKHSWTQYLYNTFTSSDMASSMMEDHAFDVAFAMITMQAMAGVEPFATAWTGDATTYDTSTMLVGNYANTLLNESYEFGSYIRHGSKKNIFENLDDDEVTLGVAWYDYQGHFMETVPTHHPFKKILGIAYFDQEMTMEEIVAPGGNVTLKKQKATMQPYMHLCEIAGLVDTDWFALTDNYHIVKAPVSVLMDDDDKPVLPYVLKDSKYCGERPNCKASMEQAEDLFGIALNYHHDKYEVLYKTDDAKMFCEDWNKAAAGRPWDNCSIAFGPTGDDYIAWKISKIGDKIADEFTPKDKTRYGWRAWTSLWNPAPVDNRMCDTTLYGVKEYLETLGNISECAVNYVEKPAECMADSKCMWRPMFESGVCLLDPASFTPETTVMGAIYSVVEVMLPMEVEDVDAVVNNVGLTTSMRQSFADLVGTDLEKVVLTFDTGDRRLSASLRRAATTLIAIFTVTLETVADAEQTQVDIETLSLEETQQAINTAIADSGFTGTVKVTGKSTMLIPAPTTTTTTSTAAPTTTEDDMEDNMTTTTTTAALPQPSFAKHFGSFSALAAVLASALLS
ncbi:unnamed protein product [Symbiodinium natans]|uniref:Uncharacterized protein n=1 Tax=Symbiodinium natans TaxID=878477 RepID=A0A812IL95_9DINO|nr:unnamed protein product [Symbiodinium natans]